MTEWKLPKPDGPEYEFTPVVKLGHTIPFGYERSDTDPDILLPIKEELVALERAKKLVKEYSYREVAAWLERETGRKISHEGLRKRLKLEQRRKQAASIAEFYAKKYKEAKEKAEKLEARVGGRDPVCS